MQTCQFVGCLPSELYKKHDPTYGDLIAISAWFGILEEEENEKLKAVVGGK